MNPALPITGFDEGHLAALLILMAVLTGTVYTELQSNRIPNWLTMGGMGAGILIGWSPWGLPLGSSLVGLAIGFGFLFLFYMFGGMGGGDVKLMGAVGALLGHQLVQPALVYTAFIGGAMGVVTWIWRAPVWNRMARRPAGAGGPGAPGELEAPGVSASAPDDEAQADDEGPAAPTTIPYGLAIVAGSLLTVFFARM